ncbi:MAG TPA: hypothetical protein VN843_22090 [Anaerolineales bacterium]|nr:hypothetical protein [Anaerolineales bacterium]
MSKDIFISYSRRDQEFVTRLAGGLAALVSPTVNSYNGGSD